MVRRLLVLNGLAVLGAVIHHAIAWDLTAMFWWVDRYRSVSAPNFDALDSLRFLSVRLLDPLISFAVFAFLVVSGYFIAIAAGHGPQSLSWSPVFQRIKRLLIPYILWTTVILGLELVQGNSYTLWQIVKFYLLGTISSPYFFVILLAQLFLLSPWLVPLARNHWKALLLVTGLLQLWVVGANELAILQVDVGAFAPVFRMLRDWHLWGYMFWFVLGMSLGFHLADFRLALDRHKWLLVTGLIVTLLLGYVEWQVLRTLSGREWISPQVTLFNRAYTLFLLLAFLTYQSVRVPFTPQFESLGLKSYGVYLIHVIPLEITARLIYHVAPWMLGYQLLFLPLLILVSILVPVMLMEILNRSPLRQHHKLVFG